MAETRAETMLKEDVVHESVEALGLRVKKLHRRISWEEIEERWLKGLCMFCNEPETPDHHLRHKNSGILMIDCDEDQPPNGEFVESIGHRTVNLALEARHENEELENHDSLVHKSILQEESISKFQVAVFNSEILRNNELREVDSLLENLEYVVMNENLEQEWVQKNINKSFEVEDDVDTGQKVLSITKTYSAHQMFGKMSQRQEKLGTKKKLKGFKSWMFKYKRGEKNLHTLVSFDNMRMVVSQQMGMAHTSCDFGLLNGKNSLSSDEELLQHELRDCVEKSTQAVLKTMSSHELISVVPLKNLILQHQFRIKHKWRIKFQHSNSVSELVICFDSEEPPTSYANLCDFLWKRWSSTTLYQYSVCEQIDRWTQHLCSRNLVVYKLRSEAKTVTGRYQRGNQLVKMEFAKVSRMLEVTQSQTFDPEIRLESHEIYIPRRAVIMV